MEAVLGLTPDEARTYSKILDAVALMPKSDPRFALIIGITWWLLHRRRRLEQQRIRRRQFFRRWRRLVLLRWQLQRNALTGAGTSTATTEFMDQAELEELTSIPENRLWVKKERYAAGAGAGLEFDIWAKIEGGELGDQEFSKIFHMRKETFELLYNELAEHLTKSSTNMREPLPGKKRLAATIFRIANNAEYLKVSTLFGIGRTTTSALVREVSELIVQHLKTKYLNWRITEETLEEKLAKSELIFGIPQCVGILGSMDAFIVGSSWNWNETNSMSNPYASLYTNGHALVFQSAVDHDGKFLHVFAGSPAGIVNEEILQKSSLPKIVSETFDVEMSKQVNEVNVPVLLVADQSYNLKDWLMTPYNLEDEESLDFEKAAAAAAFNAKISQAQGKFAEALKKVKRRWKIFHGKGGKVGFNAEAFENIALTCCILHNFCEMRGDKTFGDFGLQGIDDELCLRTQILHKDPLATDMDSASSSVQIRDALARRIFEKNELLKCLNN